MIDLLRRGRQQQPAHQEQIPRTDSDATPSVRTDLSDLVRVRRATAGLSLEAVAAATVNPSDGERLVEVDWLDRLERAALSPDEYPEYPQLDALVNVLDLDPGEVQEAAGAQFMDVHTVWSEDGQVRAVVTGELDAEDLAKVRNLMRLYRQAPRR
jgi:ribosome-binding protein aMBF1 (putative translation factor)